ncbi:MAG TPA: glycerophosphodiester phosphodiesterase [Acidimicrobiales bacterium]|nr:glycerophosphodiester phosphodiesterase [Acidimicrobiales bacterium]
MAGTRFPFLDNRGPIAFAHRGGALERMENTWSSFTHAVDLGYRYMETDVHSTRDGVVVAFHDPELSRVSGRGGLIRDLTWQELSAIELNSGDRVPRLDELLSAWPEVRWNIDAKHDTVVAPLADTLARGGAVERVCVTSFSDVRLERLKRAVGPRLCTAMGPAAVGALRLASLSPRVPAAPVRAILLPFRRFGAVQVPTGYKKVELVERRFVSAAHSAGLQVHVWTIDDEDEMVRLLDLGVDGVMTDRPTLLKQVLERRGEWNGLVDGGANSPGG